MFLKFIKSSKSRFNSNKLKWLILGNESSDLDSVVSSLVYSYYKQNITGNNFEFIPVCCLSKDNLKLKKDVITWLNRFGINSATDLIHLDDIRDIISDDRIENKIQITLVDHHRPQLHIMSKMIKEVIDHRQISYHYPDGQLEHYNIELVGSCCTLISEYIVERTLLDDKNTLLELLRGVILLDTDCLAMNNGKTTNKDIFMIEKIESYLGMSSDTQRDVFNSLAHAKCDISGLSVDMMVKRDLKILNLTCSNSNIRMAIPTLISVDVEDLLSIEDRDIQLTNISKDLNVDIMIGITCGTAAHRRVGFLLFSLNHELINKVSEHILLPQHGLNLRSLAIENNIRAFNADLNITRKKFIPILERFFKSENENEFGEQINNCNIDLSHDIYLSIKSVDSDIANEVENEGAPYSLNTPLRSYSGSPDNGNSDITLPTFNNRYTQQLVDKKRRIHSLSVNNDALAEDDLKDLDKPYNDDFSPRTFTPENSDDESISNNDFDAKMYKRNSFPLLKDYLMSEENKSRQKSITDQTVSSKTTTKSLIIDEINQQTTENFDIESSDLCNFEMDNVDQTDFPYLVNKVDEKRQKLYMTQISSVASSLVNDVLAESQSIISEEKKIESMLNDWSDSYVGDEKKEIINSLRMNDLTKVSELLTSSLIRECLKSHETKVTAQEVNNSANEVECVEKEPKSPIVQTMLIDDNESECSLENTLLEKEIVDDECHLGNMVNEQNLNIGPNFVNSSSADIVENSSFNLYRRISNNQLDFTVDEKELLTTTGDWLAKEDTIYSDTEHEENNDNHCSKPSNAENIEIGKKIIFPNKDIYMDTSNFDVNTSTEISLTDLEHMPTPDLLTMDELDVAEIVKNLSQPSSSNINSVQDTGDIVAEKTNYSSNEKDPDSSNIEKYKLVINDAGYYSDATNQNERTKLISLSSCDLPDKADENFQVIMQSIFDHAVSYLEAIDSDFYTIVYFHCFGSQQRGPSPMWLHQRYQSVSYRLKKNLKHLYIVHPTIWVRAALFLSRFFINSKFYSKIQYITKLEDLSNYIPTSDIGFPSEVLKCCRIAGRGFNFFHRK